MKLPIPTKEAIDESYSKIVRKDFETISEEDMHTHLKKYHDEFKSKQPGLYEYLTKLCVGHDERMNGTIQTPQFILYMLITIDSMYVQKEMDEVGKLFDLEGDDDE
jgi:hypothetical protein